MLNHLLLLAVTAGFGVKDKAKDLLKDYPSAAELVDVRVEPGEDGEKYLLELWQRIQEKFNLWDVMLKVGGECLCYREGQDGKEIIFPRDYLKGPRSSIKAFLLHEVAHTLGLTDEVIPTLVELAATDTLFERERDVEIILPNLLPFIERIEPTGSLDSYFLLKHEVEDKDRVKLAFSIMLLALTKEEYYHCGGIVGRECVEKITEVLTKAYLEAKSAPTFVEFLEIFEEKLLYYIREFRNSQEPEKE